MHGMFGCFWPKTSQFSALTTRTYFHWSRYRECSVCHVSTLDMTHLLYSLLDSSDASLTCVKMSIRFYLFICRSAFDVTSIALWHIFGISLTKGLAQMQHIRTPWHVCLHICRYVDNLILGKSYRRIFWHAASQFCRHFCTQSRQENWCI